MEAPPCGRTFFSPSRCSYLRARPPSPTARRSVDVAAATTRLLSTLHRRGVGALNYPRSRGWGHHGYRHRSYRNGEPSNTPAAPDGGGAKGGGATDVPLDRKPASAAETPGVDRRRARAVDLHSASRQPPHGRSFNSRHSLRSALWQRRRDGRLRALFLCHSAPRQ